MRRKLSGVLTGSVLVFGFGVALPPSVAAQTVVGTEAGLRAAFADPDVTHILLNADVELACDGVGRLARDSESDLLVEGAGDGHTISRHFACENRFGLMLLTGGGALTIRNLTLTGGYAEDSSGGAILAEEGPVTVTDSSLSGNTAGEHGGAILTVGAASVTSSTLDNNAAEQGEGGAILAEEGPVTVTNSSVSGNTAADDGGAIFTLGGVSLTNSTLTGNAGLAGGGVWSRGDVSLTHVTLVDNEAPSGANLEMTGPSAVLSVFGSVVALADGTANCVLADGVMVNSAYGFSDDSSCGLTNATDIQDGDDPQLGALVDNGGPTLTMLPADGSPLVDAIPTGDCDQQVATDQRGVVRPQGNGCDIGAVERHAEPNTPPVAEDADLIATEARPATVQIAASDPDGDDLTYLVSQQPANGTVAGDGPEFTYTSNAGFSGTDTFVVEVCDPEPACDTAAVIVTVTAFEPPAQPPADAGELSVDNDTSQPGDTITASGGGMKPGETVFLVLYSDPVRVGEAVADDNGEFTVEITVPDDTEPGGHTLVAFGEETSLAAPITVTGTPQPPQTASCQLLRLRIGLLGRVIVVCL